MWTPWNTACRAGYPVSKGILQKETEFRWHRWLMGLEISQEERLKRLEWCVYLDTEINNKEHQIWFCFLSLATQEQRDNQSNYKTDKFKTNRRKIPPLSPMPTCRLWNSLSQGVPSNQEFGFTDREYLHVITNIV